MSSNIDGILLVNKKKGMTSYDVIRKIKFAFKEMDIKTKIGHSGTLDPFAEGLLIVLLGKYTRMSDYLMDLEKTYSGTFIQGVGKKHARSRRRGHRNDEDFGAECDSFKYLEFYRGANASAAFLQCA